MKNRHNYIVAILFAIKTLIEFIQSVEAKSAWNLIDLICGIVLVIGFIINNKKLIVISLIPSLVSKIIILGLVVITEIQSLRLGMPWEIFSVIFIMNLCDVLHIVCYLVAIIIKKDLLLYISSGLLLISILIRFNGIGYGAIILLTLFISIIAIILTKDTTIFIKEEQG